MFLELDWMMWTWPTAGFFIFIATLLLCMTVAEIVYPTVERKGFLPLRTTRGDRLFIGLLSSGFIHLAWLGFTDLHVAIATVACLVWMAVLLRWG